MVEKRQLRKLGRPRKFKPEEALDKVIDVFWELGYDASDTQTLSQHTGFSKPSLYKEFGSKEDLFVAALERYRQNRSSAMHDAMATAQTPQQGIRAFFVGFAESVAGQDHPSGCLILSIAMPLRDRLPKVAKALEQMPKETLVQWSEYFNKQIENGHLPPSFDIPAATALLLDLCAAMTVQARSGVTLEQLETKADRNARLVLQEGNRLASPQGGTE